MGRKRKYRTAAEWLFGHPKLLDRLDATGVCKKGGVTENDVRVALSRCNLCCPFAFSNIADAWNDRHEKGKAALLYLVRGLKPF